MNEISKIELIDAINMYLDSRSGTNNIYTGITIESCEELMNIYCESARNSKESNIVKLWKHMIKWDCQRHKQTISWFISMIEAMNDIRYKTKMINPKGNDRNYYLNNKSSFYKKAFDEAYSECSASKYITSIVPTELPEEYELDYICNDGNLIKWIRDRAENDEVFKIKELSDLLPSNKSIPNITVNKSFNK